MLVGARHASPLPAARYAVAFCPDLIPKRIRIGVSIAAEGLSVVFPRARRKGEACFAPTNGQGVHASTHLRFYVLDCRLKRSGRGRERRISYLESCISRGEGAGGRISYLAETRERSSANSKSEARNSKQIQSTKPECSKPAGVPGIWGFGFGSFALVSHFEFRISCLQRHFRGCARGEIRDTRYGVWGLFRASDFGFRACPGMPGGGWNKNYEKNVKRGLTGCR